MKPSLRQVFSFCLLLTLVAMISGIASAQVSVGAGSYTTTLPAGATGPLAPLNAVSGAPVPTHKFWTGNYWTKIGNNMIVQPFAAMSTGTGMQLGYHHDLDGWDGNTDQNTDNTNFFQYKDFDLTIGNGSLNATNVSVSNTSDWMADFGFGKSLTVRLGRGMPFAYVLTDGTAPNVTFLRTPTAVTGTGTNILQVSVPEGDGRYTNYYGLFCPTGGTWAVNGLTYTCNAPTGKNYMSVALLPKSGTPTNSTDADGAILATGALAQYTQYAFSFPTNTAVSWNYNQSTSQVTTTYTVSTQAMEGTETGFLTSLYPHQYDALSTPSAVNTAFTYISPRGMLEVLTVEPAAGTTSFTTTDTFHGILPFMPPTYLSDSGQKAALTGYVNNVPAVAVSDEYNTGQQLGVAAQALPLAELLGDTAAVNTLQTSIESVISGWFTPTSGQTNSLFYYEPNWGSLIGYPGIYGSNTNLDGHHFHYGYWMHAAAIDGLFNPTFVSTTQYGGMVDMLRKDIANFDRTNTMFPFLRNFDVYAGHSWSRGYPDVDDGNIDGGYEDNTGEAINAWAAMILFGSEIGDTSIRDAGIWLYTQETKGGAYYIFNEQPTWVNANATNTFPSFFKLLRIAALYDDKGDTVAAWGGSPDQEHTIEYLPFTGASLYMGLEPSYVQANYLEDVAENAAATKPTVLPDMMAMYEALYDPTTALGNWTNIPATSIFGAESQAHEYSWIQSLATLGQVDATVTANTPFYAVFKNGSTETHVAFNPDITDISVSFSDGASLTVPAGYMTSDSGINVAVRPQATAPAAPTGLTANTISSTEIDLTWTATATATSYNVYRDTTSGFTPGTAIATVTSPSYNDTNLTAGTQYYYVVEAVNAIGSSPASSQATATTSASGIPATPAGLKATVASTTEIDLSWTLAPNVTYSIFRSTTSGFTPGAGNQVQSGLSVASYSDTGLTASTRYYYAVEAVNAAGSSAAATVSATTATPAADFSITATATQTVTAGSPATYTVTAAPQGNYTTSVSFACSGLPVLASCAFSPTTVTPGNTSATTTLTITTTAPMKSSLAYPKLSGSPSLPVYAAIPALGLLGLILFGGKARRNRVRQIMLSASTLVLMALMMACGSSSKSTTSTTIAGTGTPSGTSTVTITATSNSPAGTAITHTTTVQLIVQ